MTTQNQETPTFKPKKSVALSGVAAGNTALCSVGKSGNDLPQGNPLFTDFEKAVELPRATTAMDFDVKDE